jgi:hypothetical protein
MEPDFLMTVQLVRDGGGSSWPTRGNFALLQARCKSFVRFLHRHRLVEDGGWVREVGKEKPECICLQDHDRAVAAGLPPLEGCICGANGRNLHRHYAIRLKRGNRNRFGRPWLPYALLHESARRCGLFGLDLQPIYRAGGAANYVAKYLTKTIGRRLFEEVEATRACSACRGRGSFDCRKCDSRFHVGPCHECFDTGSFCCFECRGRGRIAVASREPRRFAITTPVPPPDETGWSYTSKSPAAVALEATGEVIDPSSDFWSSDSS